MSSGRPERSRDTNQQVPRLLQIEADQSSALQNSRCMGPVLGGRFACRAGVRRRPWGRPHKSEARPTERSQLGGAIGREELPTGVSQQLRGRRYVWLLKAADIRGRSKQIACRRLTSSAVGRLAVRISGDRDQRLRAPARRFPTEKHTVPCIGCIAWRFSAGAGEIINYSRIRDGVI